MLEGTFLQVHKHGRKLPGNWRRDNLTTHHYNTNHSGKTFYTKAQDAIPSPLSEDLFISMLDTTDHI